MREKILTLLKRMRSTIRSFREKKVGQMQSRREVERFPAGHFYSPVPSREDVFQYIHSPEFAKSELLDIDLNSDVQRQLLQDYSLYYRELPFTATPQAGFRYYYENDAFSYSDGIFLYCFLRKFKPNRIIEVGSGFSSALILDTIDRFFSTQPEMMFIEPFPQLFLSLLKQEDFGKVRHINQRLQDIPLGLLTSLESGDLLLIDSTHVMKPGSDVQRIFYEILPRLQPGVFVHFHDIFYPFEYPAEWLTEGRYWNEDYVLREFLSNNSEWEILFFNNYVHHAFSEYIHEEMPLCSRNPGGSIYLRRK